MTTNENDCSKTVFDKYFLHPYQEQVDVLDVKFVCMDGETISCDSRILQNLSGFFSDKIEAHRRKEEELIFKYEAYGLDIVQAFLDYCHSIPKTLEKLKLQTKVNLLSFVVYEGKCEWDGVEKTLEQKLTKLIQETILSKDYRSHSNCFCWMRDNLTAMLVVLLLDCEENTEKASDEIKNHLRSRLLPWGEACIGGCSHQPRQQANCKFTVSKPFCASCRTYLNCPEYNCNVRQAERALAELTQKVNSCQHETRRGNLLRVLNQDLFTQRNLPLIEQYYGAEITDDTKDWLHNYFDVTLWR